MDDFRRRVVVGMSGGVDSSMAAALLLEQGYQVIGVTLRLRSGQEAGDSGSCCLSDGAVQARAVAGQLGIPHHVLDGQDRFTEQVLRPCWQEYLLARTPNPCVLCNERIKFGALLDFARSLGADKVATGHYAVVDTTGDTPVLRRGRDRHKDQSYFLFALSRSQLRSSLMPLGDLTKADVREEARRRGLVTADRRESQDVCFSSPDAGFGEVLIRRFGGDPRCGEVVDTEGRVIGRHDGIHRFTIGQRRGVHIALGSPAWIKAIDAATGRVTLTTRQEDLLSSDLTAKAVVWHEEPPAGESLSCTVQVRYRQTPVPAQVTAWADGRARVVFGQPVKAVTPGQAAVFYRDDRVVGGGWIE